MPHTEIKTIQAQEVLDRIGRTLRAHARTAAAMPYSGHDFERDVGELIDRLLPFSRLSGLRLFSATHKLSTTILEGTTDLNGPTDGVHLDFDHGFEMDHLLHFRCNGDDFIVVIETKSQPVQVNGDRWDVQYGAEPPKCAKEQVKNHIKVLSEYLEPVSRETHLRFIAIVCTAAHVHPQNAEGYPGSELHLVSVMDLPKKIQSILEEKGGDEGYPFEVCLVRESGFLNLLRMSLPIKELGHPELSSAIRYVERCRRRVDEALFRHFEPTPERWVINGSAGMGKSVLLAYSAAVFATGHGLGRFDEKAFIHIEKRLEPLNLKLDEDGKALVVAAMSGKQLENLRGWFSFFIERFRALDSEGKLRVRQPEFILCREDKELRQKISQAGALLVDEAHDLQEFAAVAIAEGHQDQGFYLAVACDRHQKLRLSKDDTRIIRGLDFRLKSKRLKQIYRNPAPIYIASLALMFRWGAKNGPKGSRNASDFACIVCPERDTCFQS